MSCWYPKLKAGGVMSGHDYFDAIADAKFEPVHLDPQLLINKSELTSYGVKSAVDEFVTRLNCKLFVTQEEFPTWYFLKPKQSNILVDRLAV